MQSAAAGVQSAPSPIDRYVTDIQAGEVLGLSRSYLRQLRLKGGGPRFYSFGRAVRYRLPELHAWAADRAALSTSDRGAA